MNKLGHYKFLPLPEVVSITDCDKKNFLGVRLSKK